MLKRIKHLIKNSCKSSCAIQLSFIFNAQRLSNQCNSEVQNHAWFAYGKSSQQLFSCSFPHPFPPPHTVLAKPVNLSPSTGSPFGFCFKAPQLLFLLSVTVKRLFGIITSIVCQMIGEKWNIESRYEAYSNRTESLELHAACEMPQLKTEYGYYKKFLLMRFLHFLFFFKQHLLYIFTVK